MDRALLDCTNAASPEGESMTRSRLPAALRLSPALGLLLALAACGGPAPDAPRHAAPGAPALTQHGSALVTATATNQTCTGGVHEKHLSQFACDTCHAPNGGVFGFTKTYTFPQGTTTAGGTLTLGSGTTPTTCTVACHFPMGQPAQAITWNTPGPLACTACHGTTSLPQGHPAVSSTATRSDCQTCHDTSGHTNGTITLVGHAPAWSDPTSPGFHAFSADLGLASCQGCHGQDLAGLGPAPACASCHDLSLPAGVTSWKTNCTMCHGGTDNLTGAPPKATWGNGGDSVRVGAHTTHLRVSAIAPPIACSSCHIVPADALAAGHIDGAGVAQVTFSGAAVQGITGVATWSRDSATCSNVYCHGATLGGGSIARPVWTTVDGSQAACGTCHGLPPPAPHPVVTGGLTACYACHPATMTSAGVIIPPSQGGKHLDGILEAQAHPASWTDTTSSGFHAFSANQGLDACEQCHGLDLSGGIAGVACGSCHDQALPPGVASWKVNCTMCHGGTDNQTGAPPRATWGNAGDPIRVGAHTTHVSGSAIAPPFDCVVCHQKPADALAAGHITSGSVASIAFAGLATTGTAPAWSRATATCASTYCHGGTLAGGTNVAPVWTTVDGTQAACGTCHGLPPPAPHPVVGTALTGCAPCHPATMAADGSVIPPAAGGKHLDGVVEAVNGHAAAWMDQTSPGFHAFAADRGIATCTSCHGADLSGGTTGVACAQCHDLNLPAGVTSWKTNCTMCHGGTDNQTGAPPRATWGNGGDPIRAGAHTAHVKGSLTVGLDCVECHVKPVDALSPGHLDDSFATLTFGPLASSNGASPSWSRVTASCSATYCHGAYSGTYSYYFWDALYTVSYVGKRATPSWTDGPMACDSCHGNPPSGTGVWHSGQHGGGNECQLCHSDAVSVNGVGVSITDPTKHVNGVVDVNPLFQAKCFGCH